MLRHIFTHIYFLKCYVRYSHLMSASAALWALHKYLSVCTRFSIFITRVMSFWKETLVVGCSALILFCPSSLYDSERKREILQRLEFHYYVQRNNRVDTFLQTRKPGQCFRSPLPYVYFPLQNFLTSTASLKTAGLFLFAYLNHCIAKNGICICFSSLSLCCVEFSSRWTEETF
jgi:hypothetical protein